MRYFLFVEARSIEQQAADYVRSLGLTPILFTCLREVHPEFYRNIRFNQFANTYHVDTHDDKAMYQLIQRLQLSIAGVITCYDDMVLSTARLAKSLDLPYVNIKGLEQAFYKDSVRMRLQELAIPQPRFLSVSMQNAQETPPFLPCVIKPVRDTGAHGVHLCHSELQYKEAMTLVKSQRHSALGGVREHLLIEEFIPGELYGAEWLWQENAWSCLGFNLIAVNPSHSLCMTGIVHPIYFPNQQSVQEEILKWISAFDLRGGALNVEFKMRENRPMLIEINLRLAGANINEQIRLTTGINPLHHVIHQALNLKPPLPEKAQEKYVADGFIYAQEDGEVISIRADAAENLALISLDVRQLPVRVSNSGHNFSTILGHVLANGTDAASAMQNAQNIIKSLHIVKSPKEGEAHRLLPQP